MLAGRKDTRSSQSYPSSPLPAQSTVGERGALSVALGLKADKKVTKQQTGQAGTAIIMRPGADSFDRMGILRSWRLRS